LRSAPGTEWHEERFSPLYLDETIAGTREVSVLFADLQGFTSYAEQTSPARVAAMLNGYYGRLVPLLEAEGGVVHQIIGDAVMVIFNQNGDQPDHAARAAHTASPSRPPRRSSRTRTPGGRTSAPP
jgi:adenylate cyclase